MKGKLILCEIKFLKVLRSEPGWTIIWVLGPCSCPARAEGSCVGETREGTQGEGLQVAREVGPSGARGSASLEWGVCEACLAVCPGQAQAPGFWSDS